MTFRSCAQSPSDFARQKHNGEATEKDEKKRVVVHMSHEPSPSIRYAIVYAATRRDNSRASCCGAYFRAWHFPDVTVVRLESAFEGRAENITQPDYFAF